MSEQLPQTFKPLIPFIRRAEELDRDNSRPESKLIAHFCRQYAMELGIKLRESDSSNEATSYLVSLMDRLEQEKDSLSAFTQEEGKEICEEFALEIFSKADDEDRAGCANKNTARTFYAAGTFLDILNQFGEPSQDIYEKRRYCKYKAATILKAIKEGVAPTPGPPTDGYAEKDISDAMSSIPAVESTLPSQTLVSSTDFGSQSHRNFQESSASSTQHLLESTPSSSVSPVSTAPPAPAPSAISSFTHSGSIHGPSMEKPKQPHDSLLSPAVAPLASNAGSSFPGATLKTQHIAYRNGPVSQNGINDAIECAKFAVAALKVKDIDLAIQRLELALESLR